MHNAHKRQGGVGVVVGPTLRVRSRFVGLGGSVESMASHDPRVHTQATNAYIYITAGYPGLVALGSQFCSSSSRTRYELHSVALSTLSHAPPCVLKRSNRSSSSLMCASLYPHPAARG